MVQLATQLIRVAPSPGTGKHAKTPAQKLRRHFFNKLFRSLRLDNATYAVLVNEYRMK